MAPRWIEGGILIVHRNIMVVVGDPGSPGTGSVQKSVAHLNAMI